MSHGVYGNSSAKKQEGETYVRSPEGARTDAKGENIGRDDQGNFFVIDGGASSGKAQPLDHPDMNIQRELQERYSANSDVDFKELQKKGWRFTFLTP